MTPEAWVAAHVGARRRLEPAPGAHGRVQTWLVRTDEGVLAAVLRWGLARRKLEQEHHVATEVWPRLPGSPLLLEAEPAHGALLRTAVVGTPGETSDRAVAAAGRAVAALHALPLRDQDPVPLVDAVRLRAEAAARRVPREPGVDEALALLDGGQAFAGASRCWCHRDLQPNNWVWDGQVLGLIDWEHSRPDAPELDLAPLVPTSLWPAFAAAYGAIDRHRLRAAVALYGLVTLAWGVRHEDGAFADRGRVALRASVSGGGA